jgi:hypothetical protein
MRDRLRLLRVQALEQRVGGIKCGGKVRHVCSSLCAVTDRVADVD